MPPSCLAPIKFVVRQGKDMSQSKPTAATSSPPHGEAVKRVHRRSISTPTEGVDIRRTTSPVSPASTSPTSNVSLFSTERENLPFIRAQGKPPPIFHLKVSLSMTPKSAPSFASPILQLTLNTSFVVLMI